MKSTCRGGAARSEGDMCSVLRALPAATDRRRSGCLLVVGLTPGIMMWSGVLLRRSVAGGRRGGTNLLELIRAHEVPLLGLLRCFGDGGRRRAALGPHLCGLMLHHAHK